MAFTVEDGSVVAGANALLSVAEFKAYHDERGNSYAGKTDAEIEKAIVKGTDYIVVRWEHRLKGYPVEVDQALPFPRKCLRDRYGNLLADDAVPNKVKYAVAEYAMRALADALMPDPVVETTGQVIQKREKVGPIEEETTYSEGTQVMVKPYPAADRLLTEYVMPTGRVIRA